MTKEVSIGYPFIRSGIFVFISFIFFFSRPRPSGSWIARADSQPARQQEAGSHVVVLIRLPRPSHT